MGEGCLVLFFNRDVKMIRVQLRTAFLPTPDNTVCFFQSSLILKKAPYSVDFYILTLKFTQKQVILE
jgi:hypothetical protein